CCIARRRACRHIAQVASEVQGHADVAGRCMCRSDVRTSRTARDPNAGFRFPDLSEARSRALNADLPGKAVALARHQRQARCALADPKSPRSPTNTVSPGPGEVRSGTTKRPTPLAAGCVAVTRSPRARGEKPPAIAIALSTLMLGT